MIQLSVMQLSVVERKILGALLILSNNELTATVSKKEIALKMGYKSSSGQVSLGLKMLDVKNYITQIDKSTYKILM